MPARAVRRFKNLTFVLAALTGLGASVFGFALGPLHASPVDAANCLTVAEQIDAGEALSEQQRQEAHQACLRALSATSSVIQKYKFQEADFLITGRRKKP